LIDGRTRVVGLHELRPCDRAAVELHDVGHAVDAMADEPRENPPLALGPMREVAVARVQETLRVTAAFARPDGFAKHLDVLAGGHLQAAAAEYAVDL
jgi:hypothetical protein